MDIEEWRGEVENHNKIVSTILSDRKILKNHMEEFLKSYFNFNNLEFSNDLKEIKVSFDYGEEVALKKSLKDFPFKIIIEFGCDNIRIYPFEEME